jgi:putative nucleotidyltransferase with HDIG domain
MILFLVPFALIPIVISTFYDSRLALFIHIITIMLAGFIVPESFEFIFMNFIAGVAAIFSITNIYRRARLLFAAVVVVVSYSVIYFAFNSINFENTESISFSAYKLFAGNGLLILLSYPLIFLFEKKFFFLSASTLLELSDTNQPLLLRLAEEAPGSFQHSRQVANLAEEAARIVGANLLLARAGALYHDIGKIVNSEYFIENQAVGFSPHHELNPLESSRIIINHVNEGVMIARKYKLPVQIIDFIRTHHGTTKAYFFYKLYLETKNSAKDMEKEFIYPGPKPFSKEMAIVMMADAVEASSRTLDKYTEYNINELVERIFILQEQDDQFSDAPLTFKDISDIKSVFKKRLLNIYHSRIAYPERETLSG